MNDKQAVKLIIKDQRKIQFYTHPLRFFMLRESKIAKVND